MLRTIICKYCRKENCRFEWANISGEYKRDLNDWMNLCVSCHKKYDYTGQKAILINTV